MGRLSIVVLAAAATVLFAVPVAASSRGAAVLRADVAEWSIVPSAGVVPAGAVRIVVRNFGTEPHAFSVVRTRSFGQALVLHGDRAVAKPVAAAVVLAPGETATVRVTLTRGSYLMVDNLPWHYWKGTSVAFAAR